MVPSSRLHHWVNAHFGNGWVGCSARETGNLAKKLFQTVSGPVLEFTKKSFPRHKTALLERTSVPEMGPSAHSIFFSLALILLLSSLFLLTISRPPPPRVCLNKKSPSHFCTDVLLIFPTIPLVWVAWVSSRRSSRTGPLTLHSCTWPSRFVDQPCAAFPAPSDTASSPSRH